MPTVTNVAELCEAVAAGWRPRYLFFWGHRSLPPATAGKWYLSQWWPCQFEVDGVVYPTAEHYMMAEKARLFGAKEACRAILAAGDPAVAKRLGRSVTGFDDELWSAKRVEIVVRGNMAKFSQHSGLKAFLLSTGDAVLVEASPTDKVWGIGLAEDHVDAGTPSRWPGLNLLGFALMLVRTTLRSDSQLK